MKSIDQRPEDELISGCNCGGDHFVVFDIFEWDDIKEFFVTVIKEPMDFWYRLKKGLEYIIFGGRLYEMDVTLSVREVEKLKVLVEKFLKK